MANYVKNGKKVNDKKTLLLFVMGILVFVLLFVGIVWGIQSLKDETTYSDFKNDKIEDVTKICAKDEDKYLVYLYSESDSECDTLKEQIFKYAKEQDSLYKLYFVDYDAVIDLEEETEVTAVKEVLANLLDTTKDRLSSPAPAMFFISNGESVKKATSVSDIKGYLNDIINGGTIPHFND